RARPARIISRTRPYSIVVDAPALEWASKREAIKHHAAGTTALWRRIRFVSSKYRVPLMLNAPAACLFASPPVRRDGFHAKSWLTRVASLTLAVAVIAWVRNVEAEHAEHEEHLKKEHGGHLPEVPGYDYLNKRVKPYPWGPNSLFFNPHVRPQPSNKLQLC
ncbi:COX6A, subunit VIa of cytochrome c oxidase, partial [Russula earlei]